MPFNAMLLVLHNSNSFPLLRLLLIHLPYNLLLILRNTLIDLRPPARLIPMHPRRRRRIDLSCFRLCALHFARGVVVLVRGRGEPVRDAAFVFYGGS